MKLIVSKTKKLEGEVTPPGSKSHTIRGLMLATLAKGTSALHNILESDDTEAAMGVCETFGAKVARVKHEGHEVCLEILSHGVPLDPKSNSIHTGNSGITTHFVLPMIGLRRDSNEGFVVDSGEQMRERLGGALIEALTKLGVVLTPPLPSPARGGSILLLPLTVTGRLHGGRVDVDGSSSQYVSALLISCPVAQHDSEIHVRNLQERPYMEMTLKWLDDLGVEYVHEKNEGEDIFSIKGGQTYGAIDKIIPADFSSASYLLAAGAMVSGEVKVHGLDFGDAQGDKRLIEILRDMGAEMNIEGKDITMAGGKKLQGIRIDANDIPDLLPTLAVLGTVAEGETEIVNVPHARDKETDRIRSMTEGLRAMGAHVEERDDGLTVYRSHLDGASVHGYNDHRTIMALSLAGMVADGTTDIDTAEGIRKTYPRYVEDMAGIGASMKMIE